MSIHFLHFHLLFHLPLALGEVREGAEDDEVLSLRSAQREFSMGEGEDDAALDEIQRDIAATLLHHSLRTERERIHSKKENEKGKEERKGRGKKEVRGDGDKENREEEGYLARVSEEDGGTGLSREIDLLTLRYSDPIDAELRILRWRTI